MSGSQIAETNDAYTQSHGEQSIPDEVELVYLATCLLLAPARISISSKGGGDFFADYCDVSHIRAGTSLLTKEIVWVQIASMPLFS